MSFPTTANGCSPEIVYNVDTTQKFAIGTKMELEDGRLYRYFSAAGVCYPQMGAYKNKKSNTCAVAPTQATAAAQAAAYPGESLAAGAVGSQFVTVTIDTEIGVLTTGVLSKDELAGGYVVIGNGSGQNPQNRRILSHPALTTAGGSLTLKLDGKIITAVTAATTTIELIENPFSNLLGAGAGGGYNSFLGIPAALMADGEFGWLQRRGPCWATSNSATCDSEMDRTIVFVGNGSVESSNDETLESGFQVAGYALDTSSSGSSNAPFIWLTLE